MKCPLNILVCLSHFHPTVGGAERQLLQLARCWTASGHQVRVITRPVPEHPRRETLDHIEIHRSLFTWPLGPLFGVTFVLSLIVTLVRLRRDVDVVLAAQAPWEAVATGLFRRITGRPTIVRLANAGPFGDLRQLDRATGRGILIWLVKSNTAFLALSDQSRDELRTLGVDRDRIVRITNGVDTQYFVPPESRDERRDHTVLFVGRLTAQKDPETLLRSWRHANAQGNYRLLIAGEGPLLPHMRDLIAALQLSNVEFLGSCHDLRRAYHQASVFVLPSRSEGCSNALLEAMASGLCPVVTDIGGNRDIVANGVTGRLVATGDDGQLSAALVEVLSDGELRNRLALAAREYVVAHHDIHEVANRYLQACADWVG